MGQKTTETLGKKEPEVIVMAPELTWMAMLR